MEETLENLEKAKEFISIVRKYLEECNWKSLKVTHLIVEGKKL
jgi:hypothetical protein